MYDFKTFAQMNLDLLFKGFQRMPSPGEEVFADTFLLQLGGGPQVCSLVLDKLGCRVQLGTFLGDDDLSNISRTLLNQYGFHNVTNFPVDHPEPDKLARNPLGLLFFHQRPVDEILSFGEFGNPAQACFQRRSGIIYIISIFICIIYKVFSHSVIFFTFIIFFQSFYHFSE